MPYRDTEVEGYLAGRTIAEVDSTEAASLALANATPLPGNGYKLPMARNIVRRGAEPPARECLRTQRKSPVLAASSMSCQKFSVTAISALIRHPNIRSEWVMQILREPFHR